MSTKAVRNHHCDYPKELVIEWKCECCNKCWLYVTGPRTNKCPYGGPYTGYYSEGSDEV